MKPANQCQCPDCDQFSLKYYQVPAKIIWVKDVARREVAKALIAGVITKKPCAKCGSINSQAHHPDYRKALEVIWLCSKHHRQQHLGKRRSTTFE